MSYRELDEKEIKLLENILSSKSIRKNEGMNRLKKDGFNFSKLNSYLESHKTDVVNEKSTPMSFENLVEALNSDDYSVVWYHNSCTSYDGDPNRLFCIHIKTSNTVRPYIAVPVPGVTVYSGK